ncbi:MAG: hypothetical protein AAB373_02450 [Patescibacteria group bacterium]
MNPEVNILDKLTHDCEKCRGMCCSAQSHKPENGFPIEQEKPAGVACSNLETNPGQETRQFGCKIHAVLAAKGWDTCSKFTCYGAGQTATQFFEDIGVNWAEENPSEDPEKRITQMTNLNRGYIILFQLFRELEGYRLKYGESILALLKQDLKPYLKDFALAMADDSRKLDHHFWVYTVFSPTIGRLIARIFS